jgi:hypothetical protein
MSRNLAKISLLLDATWHPRAVCGKLGFFLVAIGLEDSWMFQVSSISIIRGKMMGL